MLASMESTADPCATYQDRQARRQAELDLLDRRSARISTLRLAVFVLAAATAWFAFGRSLFTGWFLLAPVAIFATLVVWHARIDRRQTLARRALRLYERGLRRLDDSWPGAGSDGAAFQNAEHVYTADLDVFGKGGLFELLSIARTAAGEQTLAQWLQSPAPQEEVLARQSAAQELRDGLDLREQIALLGDDVRAEVHPEALVAWSTAPAVLFPGFARALSMALAVLAVGSIIAFFTVKSVPISAPLVALSFNAIFIVWLRHRVARVLSTVDTPAADLRILHLLVACLEKAQFHSPKLVALQGNFLLRGEPASQRIAHLERLTEWLDSTDHVVMRVIAPILLLREQLAIALESWRRENGACIASWLSAAGEFEALSSIASLAYERPHWTFPTLLNRSQPHLSAVGLTHPLIPRTRAVANDVSIGSNPAGTTAPALDCQRLEYVRQEHLAPRHRSQHRVGFNRSAGGRTFISPIAIADLRVDSHCRFAAGRPLPLLRGNHTHPPDYGPQRIASACAVSP
jgi:hypothetical protein